MGLDFSRYCTDIHRVTTKPPLVREPLSEPKLILFTPSEKRMLDELAVNSSCPASAIVRRLVRLAHIEEFKRASGDA